MALPIIEHEVPHDRLHRGTLRLSGLAFLFGLAAVSPLIWPSVSSPTWLAGSRDAHANTMGLGFLPLFVLAFLLRIVPRAAGGLRHPKAATLAIVSHAAFVILTAIPALSTPTGRVAQAVALVGACSGWAASLGLSVFQARGEEGGWFLPWIKAGLLGLFAAALLYLLNLFGLAAAATEAPGLVMFGGLVPITVGLSGRMLPALAGIGPLNRDLVRRAGRLVIWVAPLPALAVFVDQPWLGVASVVMILGACASVAYGLRGLRATTDLATLPPAEAAPAAMLRLSARAAWLLLGPGLVFHVLAFVQAAHPGRSGAVPWRSLGNHMIGIGFLGLMMIGVATRVLPAFVRGRVRWPRLLGLPSLLCFLALALRIGGAFWPALLPPAFVVLLASATFFAVQVSGVIRPPGFTSSRTPASSSRASLSRSPGPSQP